MKVATCASALVAGVYFVACGSSGSSSGGPSSSGSSSGSSSSSGAGVDASSPGDGASGGGDGATMMPPTDAALLGEAGLPRTFTVTNHCAQTVWAAALPATTFPGGLVEMAPGYSFQVGVDNGWSGRIWGKTRCTTSGGTTTCASSAFPASLAELTLTKSATGLDFYDVSLVDGFNLPIALDAVNHTPDPAHPYDCGSPTCAVNLNATCAAQFQDSANGQVIACANDACKVVGNNNPSSPACTYPNQYTEFFKMACPAAYSYPKDDPTSTFTCKGFNDYAVVFCP
ncbi:MAG TPA: thaumatin family protein [Polyangiaceae bacterium]|nr:thaumatin family protein [Polyangiaceae bacterium]